MGLKWELGLKHVRVLPREHTLHIREFEPLVPRHAPQVLRSESLAVQPHIWLLHVPEVLSPAVQEGEVVIGRKERNCGEMVLLELVADIGVCEDAEISGEGVVQL